MSNTTKNDAKALREETEKLEKTQRQREQLLAEAKEIYEVAREIEADYLEQNKEVFKEMSAAEIELELFAAARYELHRRRMAALPEEVAGSVATDWRTNLSGVLQTVVGVGLFTLGMHAIPRMLEGSAQAEDVSTAENPFADTTAAAQPRPSRRRENVVPFDRSAS